MPAPLATAVTAACQQVVSLHLTAIEFYTLASAHFGRIGYPVLSKRFAADVAEEREHLDAVLGRLEFFWVPPEMTHTPGAAPGDNVPEFLRSALALENAAAAAERTAVAAARLAGDEGTAVALTPLLQGSEGAILALEGDLYAIGQIGPDNWLANQTIGG
jgi:bacterioferritin (cytochrome b1)